MARQKRIFQNVRTLAGVALIGLGASFLCTNMTEAASQLSHLFGITADGADTVGVLSAGALVVSNASQAYLFDHPEFLRGVALILLSFWPLLPVIVGALFLRVASREDLKEFKKKRMLTGRFRCPSFDA